MRRKGQSLLEILIAIGMIVFFATAFLGLIVASYGRLSQSKSQSTAALLGNEGIRAMESLAETKWDALRCPVFPCTFGLRKDAEGYHLQMDPDLTGTPPQTIFTRSIEIEPVWRNDEGTIVPSTTNGAIPDSDSRLITVTVFWQNKVKRTVSAVFTTLVSRQHRTSSIVLDTKEDFLGTSRSFAAPPQFHGTTAVQELVNGEVRTGITGSFDAPDALSGLFDVAHAPEHVTAMERDGDEVFVGTTGGIAVVSLADVSHQGFFIERTVPIQGGVSALALTDDAIFAGSENGSIHVIARHHNPSLAVSAEWTLGSSAIRTLSVDSKQHLLFVGKEEGEEQEFVAVDIAGTIQSQPVIRFTQDLPASVNSIVHDDIAAYIGMDSHELMMLSFDGTYVGSYALPNEQQHISSLAMDGDTLFILRTPDSHAPELTSWRTSMDDTNKRIVLTPLHEMDISVMHSPGILMIAPLAQKKLVVLTQAGGKEALITNEDFSGTIVVNIPGISSGACNAVTGDEQHLYLSCRNSHGADAIATVIDTHDAAGYAPWASYTTPVSCVDTTTLRHWNTMKFRTSGQGYVSVQVRVGPTVADTKGNPWLGPDGEEETFFEDDSSWQDISFLGASHCLQARVIFHGLSTCPLALDHILFTYE